MAERLDKDSDTKTPQPPCRFSVIIPALNEAEHINTTISHIPTAGPGRVEIIVVDADPAKSTIKAVRKPAVRCITAPKGRGTQLNAGAAVARGDILLFLHADTKLPANALDSIAQVFTDGRYVAGAFDLGVDTKNEKIQRMAYWACRRSRRTRIPYGDQAIFIKKDYFERLGRFRDFPIMEDVDLMRRIKKREDPIFIIDDPVLTSPRRWQKQGVKYSIVKNSILLTLYYMGLSPRIIAKLYGKPASHRKNNENQ